jgi:hypothetical protein
MDVVTVVNIIPSSHSDETNQDSEPSIAVNTANPNQIAITAFTPPDNGLTNSPIFYSLDGGATWQLNFDVPFGFQAGAALEAPGDQSIAYAAAGTELFGAFLRHDNGDLEVFRTGDVTAAGTLSTFDERRQIDQPWVEARQVVGGADDGKLRVYVGYNDDGTGLGKPSATVDVCLDGAAATPAFTQVALEQRSIGTGLRDGYAIRPVAHSDGTVYVVYERWTSGAFGAQIVTDIVVARDDKWGAATPAFGDLKDPGDGVAGRIVATGVAINDGGVLGQERLNNDLAIAVDPSNSDVVYVAWADNATNGYTLRVRRSLNRGVDWSNDLLTVANATMTGLAINSAGTVGLMYQQLAGDNWETHFRRTTDATGTAWDDLVLSRTPSSTPQAVFQPYLGDWARIVAVGKDFFGVFCANNTPDPANFPSGVVFQRHHTSAAPFTLIGSDGSKTVTPSIDPFFFKVISGNGTTPPPTTPPPTPPPPTPPPPPPPPTPPPPTPPPTPPPPPAPVPPPPPPVSPPQPPPPEQQAPIQGPVPWPTPTPLPAPGCMPCGCQSEYSLALIAMFSTVSTTAITAITAIAASAAKK